MPSESVGIAIVMLNEAQLCSAGAYSAAMQARFPDLPVTIDHSNDNEIRILRIGSRDVYLALMPPVPWTQLESLTKNAWHWEDSDNLLRAHRAHILITAMKAPAEPVERAMFMSKATAAVLDVQACLGVYWHGPAISSKALFLASVKEAAEGGHYPLLCWVSFAVVPEPTGLSVVSQGMEKLGHKEMEVIAEPGDESVMDYCLTLCDYVLKNGPVLLHGQTIGRMANEKFPIVHRPWRWDNSKGAIVIDMRRNPPGRKGFFGRLLGR